MFEDDAVFNEGSFQKIKLSLENAAKVPKDSYLYIDLAGGCSISDLKISHLALERKDGITTYRKPVTNTACAYILNRTIVEEFKRILIRHPIYRLIGIDWMMNKLLIE